MVMGDMAARHRALTGGVVSEDDRERNRSCWDDYLSGKRSRSRRDSDTEWEQWVPYTKSLWQQTASKDMAKSLNFNEYVPELTIEKVGVSALPSKERAPVGCVGIAMAQIINFWRYPSRHSLSSCQKITGVPPYGSDSYPTYDGGYIIANDSYITKTLGINIGCGGHSSTYNFKSFDDLNNIFADADGINYNNGEDIKALCFAVGISLDMDYCTEEQKDAQGNTLSTEFHKYAARLFWIPAFAGMTRLTMSCLRNQASITRA